MRGDMSWRCPVTAGSQQNESVTRRRGLDQPPEIRHRYRDLTPPPVSRRCTLQGSEQQFDTIISLLGYIRDALVEGGHWKLPVLYFDASVKSTQASKMAAIAKKHACTVTSEFSECTHVIMPYSGSDPIDGVEEWTAAVAQEGDKTLIHWWYYPDSHDTWVPSSLKEFEVDPPSDPELPYVVGGWWIMHMDRFNEYVNPLHLAMALTPPSPPSRRIWTAGCDHRLFRPPFVAAASGPPSLPTGPQVHERAGLR